MKKILWVISCIPLVFTAIVLQVMPESIPMHYDMAGNIDRWGSKYESLIFPGIILLISLLMTVMIAYYEKKAQKETKEKEAAEARTNTKVLTITSILLAGVFTIMQAFILYGSYKEAVSGAAKQAVDIGKVSVILLGVFMILLGNFMPKTRTNHTVGFRIKWSMYNDTTWRKTNRFGAAALMITGILTIVTAVVLKNSMGAMLVMMGLLLLAVIIMVIYARKVYREEVEKEGGLE